MHEVDDRNAIVTCISSTGSIRVGHSCRDKSHVLKLDLDTIKNISFLVDLSNKLRKWCFAPLSTAFSAGNQVRPNIVSN